jgi:hypothetical protein
MQIGELQDATETYAFSPRGDRGWACGLSGHSRTRSGKKSSAGHVSGTMAARDKSADSVTGQKTNDQAKTSCRDGERNRLVVHGAPQVVCQRDRPRPGRTSAPWGGWNRSLWHNCVNVSRENAIKPRYLSLAAKGRPLRSAAASAIRAMTSKQPMADSHRLRKIRWCRALA